ncbi:DUF2968 domain-containing protein [Bordetella sp. N]|uniref:DUF2968 domain-containing protein n=1 Tax=Bordetella sp. N TaxID=1746199 RepID=UPI00070BDD5F|nr:DUF2968 domain-containing protein [Bordetella sp. N]ALM83992.1 hypothetical protein ASB57_14320 [Bordetella sp. N]
MKRVSLRIVGRMVVMAGTLTGLMACASAQTPDKRPAVVQVEQDSKDPAAPVTPPASAPAPLATPAAPPASTTVAELQQLIQSRQVTELRTTYNGSYGASLLFKGEDLTYYVALFQQKNFWRVLKTSSENQAESTYRAFSNQSADLASADIQRIKLQAEYTRNERLLAKRNAELNTLQADAALRKDQETQVIARQEQARQETQALTEQQQDVRQQLRDLQRQINALQAQQADVSQPAAKPAKHTTSKRKTGNSGK